MYPILYLLLLFPLTLCTPDPNMAFLNSNNFLTFQSLKILYPKPFNPLITKHPSHNPNGNKLWMRRIMLLRKTKPGRLYLHHKIEILWSASGLLKLQDMQMGPLRDLRHGWWPQCSIKDLGWILIRFSVRLSNLSLSCWFWAMLTHKIGCYTNRC